MSMTPEQIQSEIDAILAECGRCKADGERRAAAVLLTVARSLERHLLVKAPEPPAQAVAAVEPPIAYVPVDRGGKPLKKRSKKPKGV